MNNRHDKILFWGCFIALITTSYAFISRMILCGGQFKTDFGLDNVVAGELQGAGIWSFGVSIILFSLFIDRIGYKVAMVFSFVSYLAYTGMALMAYQAIHGVTDPLALVAAQKHGYQLLYWGSIILGLGNGTVEAYANPIVSTMFNQDKVKWLNRLHAGWPAGLVMGGLCTIALAKNTDWRISLCLILIPAFTFFLILIGQQFPKSEREQAGVSYLSMLKELGVFGAFVGFGLVFAQLGQVFGWSQTVSWILTGVVVLAFAVITKSFGRLLLAFLIIIMMPQATTELGTNGWITALMEDPMKAAGYNSAWVLVYTSAIMLVLRFCAGPLVHKFSPLGLLVMCAVALPWYLYILRTVPGAWEVWTHEATDERGEKPSTVLGYLALLPYLLPWTICFIGGVITARRGMLLAVFLAVLPLVLMSFYKDRKERYMFPVTGAAAVVAAAGIVKLARKRDDWNSLDRAAVIQHWVLLVAIGVLLPAAAASTRIPELTTVTHAPWLSRATGAMLTVGLGIVIAAAMLFRRRWLVALLSATVIVMLAAHAVVIHGYAKTRAGLSDMRPLANAIWQSHPDAVMYNAHPLEKRASVDLSIYLNRVTTWVSADELAALTPGPRPLVVVMLQNPKEPEPRPPAGWKLLQKVSRDKDWWWAFVLEAKG